MMILEKSEYCDDISPRFRRFFTNKEWDNIENIDKSLLEWKRLTMSYFPGIDSIKQYHKDVLELMDWIYDPYGIYFNYNLKKYIVTIQIFSWHSGKQHDILVYRNEDLSYSDNNIENVRRDIMEKIATARQIISSEPELVSHHVIPKLIDIIERWITPPQ
jgi:elongation factor P--beta-lysine ligase